MKGIIDEIRHTIQIVIEKSEYDNKVFIKGGILRNWFMGKNYFNDVDVAVAIENGNINLSKQICDWNKCRSIYNPFTEKSKGTSVFRLFTHPKLNEVYFDTTVLTGLTLTDDVNKGMDFTCNCIYLNVSSGDLHDVTGKGIKDIQDNILRMVHSNIFIDNPLRIFRLLRLAYQYQMTVDEETKKQFLKDYKLGYDADKNRVLNELSQINGEFDDKEMNTILFEFKEYYQV